MYNTHTVYANTVIFSYSPKRVSVILERADEAPRSTWRLPTTPVPSTHTSLSALENHLYNFTGIKSSEVTYQEQLYTTELLMDPAQIVCISYMHIAYETAWHKGKGHIGLFPLNSLPNLSDSDQATISYAVERLRAKTVYTNILALLLPPPFSLATFQDAYETIMGSSVDRRNFRKKIGGLDFLSNSTPDYTVRSNTPQLYIPKDTSLQILERSL